MPEEVLFKTEEQVTRTEIANALRDAAAQLESGDVQLVSDAAEQTVTIPERPRFEVEYEIRWTK